MKKKVYTFYDKIDGWEEDKKLLDLWLKNWKNKDFEPIVLNSSDSKLNPYYSEFVETIQWYYKEILEKELIDKDNPWTYYVEKNFVRFLAYGNLLEDCTIMTMDYDIYNVDYSEDPRTLNENIIFHRGYCPCLVSGTPKKIQLFCEMICSILKDIPHEINTMFKNSGYRNYLFNDMSLMSCVRYSDNNYLKEMIKKNNIVFTDESNTILGTKLIHASNEVIQDYINNNNITKEFTNEERTKIRLDYAQKHLLDN